MGRVLALGLDAVDEADLEARMDRGELPHLQALRQRGTWCTLEVDRLCRAEHPWLAFATGRDVRSSQWWTRVTFDPATYTYSNGGASEVDPFWALGDDAAVVALDVPAAALASRLRGVQVIDWGAHDPMFPRCSQPRELLAELDAEFGTNPAAPLQYGGTWNDSGWLKRYAAALVESIQTRVKVTEGLLRRVPDWTLSVIVFGEPHQLSHEAWHGVSPRSVLANAPTAEVAGRALSDVHRALDEAVGRLGAGLEPDDYLVVFSPKGMEALCDVASSTLAPELMHRLAFQERLLPQPSVTHWRRRACPPVVLPGGMSYVPFLRRRFGARGTARQLSRLRVGLEIAANRLAYGLAPQMSDRVRARRRQQTPAPIADLEPAQLAPLRGALEYDDFYVATWYRPWWPRMPAFVLPSFSDLHVRINLAGRERAGIVAAADYTAACDEVERSLRACKDARTGRPLVAGVVRPRAEDPFEPDGFPADVVVSWAEDTDTLEHPEVGVVGPYPAWRSAGHSERAFALVAGGSAGRGRLANHRLADLPATLLDLAGATARTRIDGTPISLPRALV